ncbi:MFS transporter [Burkholderia multivorans]|uniref:MFS transporter n=1 Tax=Burkholderia multivorans TaxID=87883 RepID=UPI000D00C075|nr:MFS transporter [Burkholderia multivorans]MBU9312855.1 MFS transporter [Burkholderia multivorans]MCA8251069.1 MFS transporter [Burkholderia multivorans]MCA8457770.1 MFS transporter [Burkholderia multivorans]MDN7871937.1 MFS transporter [Burkholderia multivorans]PRE10900.1 MFS transporter [Burkholderia multivorans]
MQPAPISRTPEERWASSEARTAAQYPSAGYAWYVIGVLFVVTLMSQTDRLLPSLVVGPLRREFGISDTAFSLLQGYAFAVFYTLAGLPLGRLVDRGSRRNLICAGLVFWGVATALFAFGQTYTQLLLARVGVGIGEAVLAPAAYSLIADCVEPARRGRALAVYYTSLAIGSGASLLLGGWLLAVIPAAGMTVAGFGHVPAWRVAFVAAALPSLPLALLMLASVREPVRHETTPSVAAERAASVREFARYLHAHAGTFARVLTYPALLSIIGYGALAWAPTLFARSFGMPPAHSGLLLGLIVAIAGAAGTLASGALSDRWAARGVGAARFRVALAGVCLFAAPSALWPLMPNAPLAFALLFVNVLGLSVAQAAAPTSIQAVVPNRLRGQAIALYLLLAGLLGIGLGPTAVALLTEHLFHQDAALRYSLALTAAPAALLGLWLTGSGLRPYARTYAALHSTLH